MSRLGNNKFVCSRLGTPDSHSPELFGQDRYQPSQFHPMNDKSVIAAVSNNGFLTQGAYFGHSPTSDVPASQGATALDDWERHQVFRDLTSGNDDSLLFPTADLPGTKYRVLAIWNQGHDFRVCFAKIHCNCFELCYHSVKFITNFRRKL